MYSSLPGDSMLAVWPGHTMLFGNAVKVQEVGAEIEPESAQLIKEALVIATATIR